MGWGTTGANLASSHHVLVVYRGAVALVQLQDSPKQDVKLLGSGVDQVQAVAC